MEFFDVPLICFIGWDPASTPPLFFFFCPHSVVILADRKYVFYFWSFIESVLKLVTFLSAFKLKCKGRHESILVIIFIVIICGDVHNSHVETEK